MAGGPAGLEVIRHGRSGVVSLRRRSSTSSSQTSDASPQEALVCELCHRESNSYTVHHLIPRAEGGKFGPTALLCPTCHRQLHANFSEGTLAKELNSIDRIRSNPEMAIYLSWVRKQKAPTNFRVRRANHRR